MEEKEKYNIWLHIIITVVCSFVWAVIAYLIFFYLPYFPQKLLTVKFNPEAVFSFELSHIIAIIVAFVSHYILMVKCKVYFYSFRTDCVTPFLCLFASIFLGGLVCFLSSLFVVYTILQALFIAGIFVFISIINYFIFFSRHGHEFEEDEDSRKWHKTVVPPIDIPRKD